MPDAAEPIAVLQDAVTAAVVKYRHRLSYPGELVLVLPRRLADLHGQDRLAASFRRLGVQHVQFVEDWNTDLNKVNMLLYAAGTWHTGHGIDGHRPGCEGCDHVPA